ncbi:MAG: oxidoreductase [Chloroflexi bacterium]|nr:oxidoreductase [Chloroflexota bacterium]
MAKLKLGLYWAATCGGCDVAALADIVFWPIALDFKKHHVEAMKDKEIDITLWNGAVRSSEHEEMAHLLRAKSKAMVAFGACACFGGIPALGNFTNKSEIFERVYITAPSSDNPNKVFPQTKTKVAEGDLTLPEMWDTVLALGQVVDVQYYIPGCPPTVPIILKVVEAIAGNALPPPGAVIAGEKTLCDECPRKKEEKKIARIYRSHELIPVPEKCLLEQGLVCMGPATRGGCGALCINANMPCRGCFGPPPGVYDQGAKMLSALASIYEASDEKEIARMVDEMVDPAGTFYRFGMSTSMLKRKR